jgi:plastocyanin
MRRSLLLPAIVAVAALVAACSSSSAPGWTYAAPTSPPPSQAAASGGASGAPASQAPASQAPGSQAPASGGTASGPVQISAQGVQFEQKDVSAPAGAAFTIHFDNKDAGQPHNVNIKDASGASAFKGDLVTGPAAVDYQVPALTAGTYTFVCDVHANMTGTLTAG